MSRCESATCAGNGPVEYWLVRLVLNQEKGDRYSPGSPCPVRLTARPADFQSANRSSILLRDANCRSTAYGAVEAHSLWERRVGGSNPSTRTLCSLDAVPSELSMDEEGIGVYSEVWYHAWFGTERSQVQILLRRQPPVIVIGSDVAR